MKNLLFIGTIFTVLILGCAAPKESTQNAPAKSPNATATTKPATAEPPVKETISDVKWKDFDGIFGVQSKTTDLQKESAWKNYEGKTIQWNGKVVEVSEGTFGGLTLNVKMNNTTLTYDVTVNLKESEKSKASGLTKDKTVTFVGKLKSYGGAILPTTIDDGEIK